MASALRALELAIPDRPLIWGGDWNQSLIGKDYAGSTEGRQHLLASIDRLSLQMPTAGLRHQLPDHASIDHIALPQDYLATQVEHLPAKHQETVLSDHDAYVTEIDRPRQKVN
jgi:endonuclease/exonuclease/phosphatase family metal-dependent hydrolase